MVHGCAVYTERAETAAVLRVASHVTTKQRYWKVHHLDGYSKTRYKKLQTLIYNNICDKSAVSLLESGE